MSRYSPFARPENADPSLAMFSGPMDAIEMWVPVWRAAAQWNANFFEIVADSQREWLDFAKRRLTYTALPQDLATCRSYQAVWGVYTDFFQQAVADCQKYFAEMVKPDRAVSGTTTNMQYANRADGPDHPGRLHGDEDNHE
jgi:hypothetical protein